MDKKVINYHLFQILVNEFLLLVTSCIHLMLFLLCVKLSATNLMPVEIFYRRFIRSHYFNNEIVISCPKLIFVVSDGETELLSWVFERRSDQSKIFEGKKKKKKSHKSHY